MRSKGSQQIYYAGHSVIVEYNQPIIEKILSAIIYPFPTSNQNKNPSILRVEYLDGPDPTYILFLEGEQIYKSKHLVDFAEMLLSKICYQLAFYSKDGVLFHAAGLGYNDKGILVPGGIGFGKSTFAAWMISQGCDYLSDEFVYFPWESHEMLSFYRPLHIKKPSRKVLDNIINYDDNNDLMMVGSHSDLIHPKLIRPNNHYYQPPVRLILFPHYKADSELEWQELTPGQTGLELMQFLINARNLPEYGFSEISRLARSTEAIKFKYSNFGQLANVLKIFLR